MLITGASKAITRPIINLAYEAANNEVAETLQWQRKAQPLSLEAWRRLRYAAWPWKARLERWWCGWCACWLWCREAPHAGGDGARSAAASAATTPTDGGGGPAFHGAGNARRVPTFRV